MKTYRLNRLIWLFLLTAGWIPVQGQSQMEVPGDNFSLEGALELFKKSSSPEEFERMLNDPESRVNNLDLNGDSYIDYIRVVDYNEGNVHAFVMQAAISDRESQDIAVITLEKMGDGKAILQITGDEDIYGVETIIEPTKEVRTYGGSRSSRVVVNVWAWPLVSYVYGPYYSAWISPWGWGYRPVWWSPWRPIVYYDYYSYWNPYRVHYSHCHTHRVVYAYYRPHRSTSVIVHTRHSNQIARYRSTRIDSNGRYNDSRRSSSRSSSVRYDSNGRISASSSQRISSGSSNSRTSRSSADYNRRSATSSGARESYSGSSGSSRRSATSPNVQRSTNRSSESTNSRGSSVNSGSKRSYSGSSSGSNSRSSSTPNVQRSSGRSSGGSDVSRPSSNSGSRQSYGKSSSGSSSRSSSGSSSSGRSSGSSGSGRSSGSSSGRGRH